jgi:acylphosphatase
MEETVHRNFKVTGKVQGVFYRDSMRQKAKLLGVQGFAENRPDGSVYAEAEGTPEALDELEAWCKEGPTTAEVQQVEVSSGSLSNFKSFSIRH